MKFLLKLVVALAAVVTTIDAQVTASFSDQGGPGVIKLVTGHAPKNVRLLGIHVCNGGAAAVTVDADRVISAITVKSTQHPAIVNLSLVNSVLTNYEGRTRKTVLANIANATTASVSALVIAKAISITTPWGVGLVVAPQVLTASLAAVPQPLNLIGLGQNLLQGNLALAPLGCQGGLVVVISPAPLTAEEVDVAPAAGAPAVPTAAAPVPAAVR